MLCLDNSEWMRNGDWTPSRAEAQQDAVNLVCGAKTQQNPENSVGILSMAGERIEVLSTLTTDVGKILSSMHHMSTNGHCNFSAGVQVAQLALKHRQNKNQRQRIIVFVGSPVNESQQALVKLGKKLKKNNVAIDIVNFGEESENTEKLEAFLNTVNSNDNRCVFFIGHLPISCELPLMSSFCFLLEILCINISCSHLITVPPGPHVLSDILVTSPMVAGEDSVGMGAAVAAVPGVTGGGGGDGFAEFGVDPSVDPEFAWALRVSMEEERQRQEAEVKKKAEEGGPQPAEGTTESTADSMAVDADASNEDDEAALLQAALAMSMQQTADESAPAAAATHDAEMKDVEEDDEMALALQLSMAQAQTQPVEKTEEKSEDLSQVFQDANFVQSVLTSLPGVDPSDPRIKSVINSLPDSSEEKKDEEEKND